MIIIAKHSNETAREYALRVLRDNIITLNLKPGSQVSVYELSSMLGISRTPIREALLELRKAKIIDIFPQKGSVIAYIDSDMVEEARFMRAVLEVAIVELACDLAKSHDLEELDNNIKMQEVCITNQMRDKLLQLDNEFHYKLYKICKKENIYAIKDMMSIHFDRVRNMSLNAVKDLKIINDHKNILDAIKNRDKKSAKEFMEKHLSRYSIDDETRMREMFPEYFINDTKWFAESNSR